MKRDEKQAGQVLVQVALMLVVLLGFLALAVDVSQVYLKRRQLQNAADAAALEGARYMCFETFDFTSDGHDAAQISAGQVALANAPGATVRFPTPDSIYAMTAVVTQTIPSFVASIVGQSQFNPGARATAVCGGAETVCGLWPVAFDTDAWDDLYDHDGNGTPDGCGRTFFVWAGHHSNDNVNENKNPDCTLYDCDYYPDQPGVEMFNQQGRSWLDFTDIVDPLFDNGCASSNGCGTNELTCWLESNSVVRLTIDPVNGACIAGDNGVRAAAKDEIDSREGDKVAVPLYDSINTCTTSVCPGGDRYHVTRLGCIEVVGWRKNLELNSLPANPKYPQDKWKGNVVEVKLSCGGCNTACGSTSGGPPSGSGVNAVSLIE